MSQVSQGDARENEGNSFRQKSTIPPDQLVSEKPASPPVEEPSASPDTCKSENIEKKSVKEYSAPKNLTPPPKDGEVEIFLSPHNAKTVYMSMKDGSRILQAPDGWDGIWIGIEEEVLLKLQKLLHRNQFEFFCQGLCTFELSSMAFIWYDLIVAAQTSYRWNFDMSSLQGSDLFAEAFEKSFEGESILDRFEDLKIHFHSHRDFSVEASKMDNDFIFTTLENSHAPYFIRVIGNKLGQLEFTLFLVEEQLMIIDVPWKKVSSREAELDAWAEQICKDKITVSNEAFQPPEDLITAPWEEVSMVAKPRDLPARSPQPETATADSERRRLQDFDTFVPSEVPSMPGTSRQERRRSWNIPGMDFLGRIFGKFSKGKKNPPGTRKKMDSAKTQGYDETAPKSSDEETGKKRPPNA